MSKRFDVRLVVGIPNGPRSDVWHYWSRNESVYVANAKMGGIVKFSFHPPDICRYAFTKEYGTSAALPDRATEVWRRDPTLPAGARKVVRVLRVGFWTDVLSTALASPSKEPVWIKPAPLGNTTIVDLMFTRDDEVALRAALATEPPALAHTMVAYRQLSNGEAFCISAWHSPTADKPLRVQGNNANDLLILPYDPTDSGRPIRFTAFSSPKDGGFMEAWDFGAFAHRPLSDAEWDLLLQMQE
jgi:hypothetical protein